MKKITIHVPEEKHSFLLELLKNFDFVTKIETTDENELVKETQSDSDVEQVPLKVEKKVLKSFLNKL